MDVLPTLTSLPLDVIKLLLLQCGKARDAESLSSTCKHFRDLLAPVLVSFIPYVESIMPFNIVTPPPVLDVIASADPVMQAETNIRLMQIAPLPFVSHSWLINPILCLRWVGILPQMPYLCAHEGTRFLLNLFELVSMLHWQMVMPHTEQTRYDFLARGYNFVRNAIQYSDGRIYDTDTAGGYFIRESRFRRYLDPGALHGDLEAKVVPTKLPLTTTADYARAWLYMTNLFCTEKEVGLTASPFDQMQICCSTLEAHVDQLPVDVAELFGSYATLAVELALGLDETAAHVFDFKYPEAELWMDAFLVSKLTERFQTTCLYGPAACYHDCMPDSFKRNLHVLKALDAVKRAEAASNRITTRLLNWTLSGTVVSGVINPSFARMLELRDDATDVIREMKNLNAATLDHVRLLCEGKVHSVTCKIDDNFYPNREAKRTAFSGIFQPTFARWVTMIVFQQSLWEGRRIGTHSVTTRAPTEDFGETYFVSIATAICAKIDWFMQNFILVTKNMVQVWHEHELEEAKKKFTVQNTPFAK